LSIDRTLLAVESTVLGFKVKEGVSEVRMFLGLGFSGEGRDLGFKLVKECMYGLGFKANQGLGFSEGF
jgi:hypothetical protein